MPWAKQKRPDGRLLLPPRDTAGATCVAAKPVDRGVRLQSGRHRVILVTTRRSFAARSGDARTGEQSRATQQRTS